MNLSATDLIDQVRTVLPSVTDETELLAAAEMLAASLNAEQTTYGTGQLDPRAFDGRTFGGVPDHSAVPDAWVAIQHQVKRTRSQKGHTSAVVGRRGVAPVIGAFDRDVHGQPILATPDADEVGNASWCAAQMLARRAADGELHRLRAGWSGLAVQRLTDEAFALDPEVQMVGTEAESWAERQVSRADRAVRFCIAGMSFGSIVAQSAAYTSHTAITWPTRYTLKTGRRRANDPTDVQRTETRWFGADASVPNWSTDQVTHLVAPADDGRMFQGYRKVNRGQVKVARGGRAARTVIALPTDRTPDTAAGWQTLADAIAPGERITCADGKVTICRTNDRYTCTDNRTEPARYTVRSAASLAARLA